MAVALFEKNCRVHVGLAASTHSLGTNGFGETAHVGNDAVDDLLLQAVGEEVALLVGRPQSGELLAKIDEIPAVS
jgi:hypothetical protein